MGRAAGSILKVTLDGITFDVFADANLNQVGSQTENSMIPTSGKAFPKKMKRIMSVEGLKLVADPNSRIQLEELADRLKPFPMSYKTADGTVFRAKGIIEFESAETEEIAGMVKMLPDGKWEKFVA